MTMVLLAHLLTLLWLPGDVIPPKCPPNSSKMLTDRPNKKNAEADALATHPDS